VVPPDSAVTHILLDEGHLWGRKRVAIPIREVTGIDDDGVAVRLTKDQIKELPPVDVEGLEIEDAGGAAGLGAGSGAESDAERAFDDAPAGQQDASSGSQEVSEDGPAGGPAAGPAGRTSD